MRGETRRPVIAALLVAALALPLGAASAVESSSASWTDTELTSARFTTGTILPPSGLRCSPKSGLLSVAIQLVWNAPTGTATGVVPTSYRITVLTSGGTVVHTGTSTTTTYTIPTGLLSVGSFTARVEGLSTGGAWVSTAITDAITVVAVVGYSCAT